MKSAFQLDIQSVVIRSANGTSFDATQLFTQIVLHESMYSTAMSGNIQIQDDYDHFELLPIVGQEFLRIEVNTLDNNYVLRFYIYKISDIKKLTARKSEYTLFFVSEEQYLNENNRISKSYQNTTYDKIAADIMKTDVGTKKQVIVEETMGTTTYVAPNIRPFKAIRQVMKRAVSAESGGSNFVFFEDRRGYIIATMNNLLQRKPKYTYRFKEITDSREDSVAQTADFFAVEQFDIKKQTDSLEAINGGMFASQLHTVDLLQRKVDVYDYGYFDEFQKLPHLNKHPVYHELRGFDEEGNQYFTYTNETALDNSYIQTNDSGMNVELSSQTRLNRRLQLQMLNSYVFNMTIPGNVLLFIGDVIEMEVYSNQTKSLNTMLSGNVMVTAITHVMTAGTRKYQQRIETVKDSIIEPLGSAT